MDEALFNCENLADWRVAAKAHPEVAERYDSVRLLASLCASAPHRIMESRLCDQAFIAHPGMAPAAARN